MTLWTPREGEMEIGEVVRGIVKRREEYWALQGIPAKFSFSDVRMIERAMMEHKHEAADLMMDVAAYVVVQIEEPWRERAQKAGTA